ncbi:flagellar basal body-associated FliL family protein [Seleniivibrio sp.]|uniref:flagellar basal body-associated FliL family protein n=1 Tax=Seleniivibrio sp. TaxID=2898801 RepID=UPI0025D56E74|nr:flagellar basal body-associated FliL family protein [Seleniivibrio sp.]MCD8553679.1 flagellar basal body-associated FliL family protein [Seleniivibrio sp.]
MAAEEEKTAEEGGKKKKGGKLKLIIIVVVLLIILLGGVFLGYKLFLAPKDATAEGEMPKKEVTAAPTNEVGVLYPLETFIVNMADNDGSRYLKVTVQLELDNTEKLKEELDKRVPQLRDAILTILSAKTYEEVSSAQGKLILKQEILRRLNSLLPFGQITNIYFTEFVAQ